MNVSLLNYTIHTYHSGTRFHCINPRSREGSDAADLTQILRETRKEIAKLTDKRTADTFIKRAVDMIDSDLDAEGIRMFFEGVAIICEQTNEDISKGRK